MRMCVYNVNVSLLSFRHATVHRNLCAAVPAGHAKKTMLRLPLTNKGWCAINKVLLAPNATLVQEYDPSGTSQQVRHILWIKTTRSEWVHMFNFESYAEQNEWYPAVVEIIRAMGLSVVHMGKTYNDCLTAYLMYCSDGYDVTVVVLQQYVDEGGRIVPYGLWEGLELGVIRLLSWDFW